MLSIQDKRYTATNQKSCGPPSTHTSLDYFHCLSASIQNVTAVYIAAGFQIYDESSLMTSQLVSFKCCCMHICKYVHSV